MHSTPRTHACHTRHKHDSRLVISLLHTCARPASTRMSNMNVRVGLLGDPGAVSIASPQTACKLRISFWNAVRRSPIAVACAQYRECDECGDTRAPCRARERACSPYQHDQNLPSERAFSRTQRACGRPHAPLHQLRTQLVQCHEKHKRTLIVDSRCDKQAQH